MNVNDKDLGAPIQSGSPLARALDDFAVPGLAADFAERVTAATETRPAPLPGSRRPSRGWRWRAGRRIAMGMASFGVVATAAAATGLLQRLDIPVPSADAVWASISGSAAAPAKARAAASKPAPAAAATPAPVEIVGPVDTPEELGEAFRRIDEARQGRRAERRQMIDQRIADEIARRRDAGLPVPSAEEEARLRARIEQALSRNEQRADRRMDARRELMQHKVESGEALTREDILGSRPTDAELRARLRQLRQMSPAERREAWRRLPPGERRVLLERARTHRVKVGPAPTPVLVPEPAPGTQPVPAE